MIDSSTSSVCMAFFSERHVARFELAYVERDIRVDSIYPFHLGDFVDNDPREVLTVARAERYEYVRTTEVHRDGKHAVDRADVLRDVVDAPPAHVKVEKPLELVAERIEIALQRDAHDVAFGHRADAR